MIFITHTLYLIWQNLLCSIYLSINVNFILLCISTNFKSFFAFLRWTVVAFLICLCVYLLWTDSHLQTLNAPSISTYTVPNKISQNLTIEYSTAHSPQGNKKYLVHMPSNLFLLFLGCGCSWKNSVFNFIFYLYTPYIVLQLYFLVCSLSWCNPPYWLVFVLLLLHF